MELVKPKKYYWVTPNGTFNCPKEAGKANGCSDQMIKHRCNKYRKGYYKSVEELEELSCNTCGITHPLDKNLIRSETRKGKRYFFSECNICKRVRDSRDKKTKPYVYRFVDTLGNIVYIGKTFQLKRRIRRHFNEKPYVWKQEFTGVVEVAEMANSADMNIMEQYLISIWNPPHNSLDNFGEKTTFCLPTPEFKKFKEIKNGKIA